MYKILKPDMKWLFICILTFSGSFLNAQLPNNYSIEGAEVLCNEEPRNIVLFFKADWCRFCHNMLVIGFPNQENRAILNDAYYFVLFDIESKEDIRFRSRDYKGTPQKKHELLNEISGNENVSLPYLVILSPSNEILFENEGFLNPQELNAILEKAK
jgi:thioredoxin-related protein